MFFRIDHMLHLFMYFVFVDELVLLVSFIMTPLLHSASFMKGNYLRKLLGF